MTIMEKVEAHTKTLTYAFWQADKRDWTSFIRYGYVSQPQEQTMFPKSVYFFKAMPDGAKIARNALEIYQHWYMQASKNAWRRSIGAIGGL